MPVGSGISPNIYTANGVATVYAYEFTILTAVDMVVTVDDVVVSAYSLSGVGSADGGSVTFDTAPADGAQVILRRLLELVRDVDYQSNGDLPNTTLNNDFDRLWLAMQQVDGGVSRALRVPFTETMDDLPDAESRALRLLGFDADGAPSMNTPTSGDASELALLLASSTLITQGVGMSGIDPALAYEPGTAGWWLTKGLTDFHVLKWIPPAEWSDIIDGTSTYDAAAAWTSAINAAIASGRPARVTGAAGYYKLDTPLGYFTGASDVVVDLTGITLDFSDADTGVAGALIGFQGTYGDTELLTSNAAQNGQTIACDSSAFAVGDMVRIYSNAVWDSLRTSSRYGELNFIESVPDGVSVTTVAELETAYNTADTATIQKLTPVQNCHVYGGTIIGPVANDLLLGIDIKLGLACTVEHVNTRNIDVAHMRLVDSAHCHVRYCDMDFASNPTQAYAVSMTDACQDCSVKGNTMRNVRHAFTTNNTVASSWGITRRIDVEGNFAYNNIPNFGGSSGDAFDSHAGSSDIRFINNVVKGAFGIGINAEGRSTTVRGNRVRGATAQGIRVVQYPDVVGTVDVSGNTVDLIGDGTGTTDYGIFVATIGSEIQGGTIGGNTMRSKNESLVVRGTSSFKIRRVAIAGNSGFLRNESLTDASLVAAEVSHCEYSPVSGNQFTGRTIALLLENVVHIPVNGNQLVIDGTSGANGYGIRAQGTNGHISSTGNTLSYVDTGIVATVGVSYGGTTTDSGAWCNTTEGFGTNVNVGGGSGCVAANNI